MNVYKSLNEIINYIENNLEKEIDYKEFAKIMLTNEYTVKRIFKLLTDISVTDYIRNRRLSNAGVELAQNNVKIIDIAIKYQYENATSFSRAFEKFHGIKPSSVKNNPDKLKIFPKLKFNEDFSQNESIEYSIVELDELNLYGIGFETDFSTIGGMVPQFFEKIRKLYANKYGSNIPYGVVIYEDRIDSEKLEYYIAYDKEIKEFKKIYIPKSKWIKIRINSTEAKDIQRVSHLFYEKFFPSSNFRLRPIPELEYYHDDITDFLIPIEN